MRASSGARSNARSRWGGRAKTRASTAASRASWRRRCSTSCATPSTTASRPRRCARAAASRAPGASTCAPRPPGPGCGSRSPTTAPASASSGCASRPCRPACPTGRPRRLDDATVVERDGRSFARLPVARQGPDGHPGRAADAGEEASGGEERLVAFVPLARLYGQTPAERQVLLEGQVSGQPLALVVDDVLREQEVLVRPITRRVATDRLLEGVALLASGEPVGVLSPAVLAQREYLRALPVAAARTVGRRGRGLLVEDSPVTRARERRLLEEARFRVTSGAEAAHAD